MTLWDTIGSFFYNLTADHLTVLRLFCFSALVIGYLCGLFQSAYFISKIKHVDIYSEGSGNPGATNMFRVMGFFPGLLTFLLDIGKVVGAIFLTQYLFLTVFQLPIDPIVLKLYTGLGAVLGHDFPVTLRGRGGKGVAATSAVIICLGEWKYIFIGLAVFLLVVLISRYVSLASMTMIICCMFSFLLFTLMNITYIKHFWLIDCQIIMILFSVLVLVTHRKNILRLLYNEESRFSIRKKKDPEEEEEEYEDFEELPVDPAYCAEDYPMEEPDEESRQFLEQADSLFAEHAELLQSLKNAEAEHVDLNEETAAPETAAEEDTKAQADPKAEEDTATAAEPTLSVEAADSAADLSAEAEQEEESADSSKTQESAPSEETRQGEYRTNHNKAAPQKKKKKHSSTKKKKSNSTKKKRK